ncbi:MAG: M23 family metallopeptidase [Ruminococcaceae bacterium]|nr:M23 family metallopeptidase [Oscillospiraceae bacterium]
MRYPNNYITITQIFKPGHLGADLGWNSSHGGPYHDIIAIAGGVVVATTEGYNCTWPDYKSYGNYVYIDHGNGITAMYAHLKRGSVAVKRGQRVVEGQKLGQMGNSGWCIRCAVHLHFEIRKNGNKVDPIPYLRAMPNQYISDKTLIPERIKRGEEVTIKPEAADRMRDQIKVNIDNLNIRSNPYLGDNKIGMLQRGIYNVYEQRDMTHEQSNGYLWYRIADNVWCAQVNGVDFYKAELPEIVHPTELEKANQTINEMKKDFKLVFDIVNKYS